MPALHVAHEQWPYKTAFRIAGHTFTTANVVTVTLRQGHAAGRGEAAGVYYHQESAASMIGQIEGVRSALEAGVTREELRALLPPGGARNAIDCALWDLEAQLCGASVWRMADVPSPKPLATTYTVSAGTPDEMAATARSFADAPRLKLKLTGEGDAERLRAVRAARPDAWLGVDANQGFTRTLLEELLPTMQKVGVQLIEQPLKVGEEEELYEASFPIPIAADESVQELSDLERAAEWCDVVNIKLDKCGGLTTALMMAARARQLGLNPMVGCMESTSLAMAPAFIVGQLCDVVDLDGPLFLKGDRESTAVYARGEIDCRGMTWGNLAHAGAR